MLGGGVPEYSFNLIAGAPGTGRTTLSQQIMFGLATPERPALHFTIVGEPSIKMPRYQQQFIFFDAATVGSTVHYVNLSDETLDQGLDAVLEAILAKGGAAQPRSGSSGFVRTLMRAVGAGAKSSKKVQRFLERLAIHLTTWQATTFWANTPRARPPRTQSLPWRTALCGCTRASIAILACASSRR